MLRTKEVKTDKKTLATDVIVVVQPQNEPMYSDEFLAMMQDHAYETLHAYLKSRNLGKATALLEDLMVLSSRTKHEGQAAWVENQFMCEAVARTSKDVLKLGGHFYKPAVNLKAFE